MKPYAKAQTIRLQGMQDRRRRLTDKDKDDIRKLYAEGKHSLMSLARMYHVSKSLILITVNPRRAMAVKERGREHWRDYAYKYGKEYRARMARNVKNHHYRLFKAGELKRETICKGAKMRKVLVVDDHYFMKEYVAKCVPGLQVDRMYALPDEESALRGYDALVIDGEGIGNATYRHGLEFCRQYDKPDGQAVVYCSGLHPGKEDCEILEKRGIAVVDKGGNPEKLALCVKFAMEKKI